MTNSISFLCFTDYYAEVYYDFDQPITRIQPSPLIHVNMNKDCNYMLSSGLFFKTGSEKKGGWKFDV